VEGGTVNTQVFTYYLEHVLAPQLRPGQIVVLDNLPVHKAAGVAECLHRHDCKLMFLPTYSPDLNPIELLFAKLKADLRCISAASLDALSLAIHQALKRVELHHLIGYFRHAGYLVY
jgi:transposase